MANNKMYENYLMHYRTPGSKNGYTKYPGKYTPIGEKAKEDYVAPLGNTRNAINSMTSEDFSKIINSKDRTGHIDSTNISSAWRNYNFRRNRYGSNAQNTENNIVNTTRRRGPNSAFEAQQIQRARANQRAAENRRIAGGSQGTVTRAEAASISASQRQREAEARRIKGGRTYGTGDLLDRENDRFNKIHEGSSKLYNAAVFTRNLAKEATKAPKPAREAEARRIAGGNPYVNQREENRKAAEQRRIAGGSGISASQRQKEAEARRIAGGTQGTITTAEAKRKNINDWYGNQVRGGNQSAAEARRIKGGTSGATTTAQAAAKNAESEKKKKKLKGVLKALLKSRSKGISRLF